MKTPKPSPPAFLAWLALCPSQLGLGADKKVPVGLELYSVRGRSHKDLPALSPASRRLGYQWLSYLLALFRLDGRQGQDVRRLLDDLGIKCLSTHNGGQSLGDGLPKAIELNQIIGSKYIVQAGPGKIAGLDGWKAVADRLSVASEKLKPLGMAAGFHNHQLEWRPVEGKRPMDILARTRRRKLSCSSTRYLRRSRRDPSPDQDNPGGSRART